MSAIRTLVSRFNFSSLNLWQSFKNSPRIISIEKLTFSTTAKSEEHSPEPIPDNTKPKQFDCEGCNDLSRQLANALKEHKEVEERVADVTDKYKRALAEMENVRLRLMKQAEDARIFAVQSFAKDLLVVADSLSQASKSVSTASAKIHDDGNFRALYDGLQITDNQLHQVFARHGLAKIEPAVGDKFDPKLHEALFQQDPTKGEASGTISNVQKIGYSLKERCIRPAIVGVFK